MLTLIPYEQPLEYCGIAFSILPGIAGGLAEELFCDIFYSKHVFCWGSYCRTTCSAWPFVYNGDNPFHCRNTQPSGSKEPDNA